MQWRACRCINSNSKRNSRCINSNSKRNSRCISSNSKRNSRCISSISKRNVNSINITNWSRLRKKYSTFIVIAFVAISISCSARSTFKTKYKLCWASYRENDAIVLVCLSSCALVGGFQCCLVLALAAY